MMYHHKRLFMTGLFSVLVLIIAVLQDAQACSRVLHVSKDGTMVVTGRTMDWFEDIESNLWLFPCGMKRNGVAGKNSAQWVSKYGSVIAAGFDAASTDGINEKGLVVNILYLAEADFGKRDETRPGLSWSVYAQYLLDNFATVAEAVAAMKSDRIQVVASPIPGSIKKPPTLHFSISDASGDSAIFEYLNGKLVIHHGKKYKVMTNSPPYDRQIALNAYWESVGGDHMLPGTCSAADRYVRGTYYLKQMPDPKTHRQALANVMSVMRNISVPFCKTDPDSPNLSPTIWRTAADQERKIYYFESTLSPSIVWVLLDKLDFKQGAAVKKLDLVGNYDLTGDVSGKFTASKPFIFIGPDSH
ncbi:linear amide C-N hydrolase [Verrucomicrobiota bacterium]